MKNFLSIIASVLCFISFSQELVLIKFKDKPSSSTYLNNPTSMLSQQAIDRRFKYNIPIDETDVPVELDYVSQIKALGVKPIATSKWFNGIFTELTLEQISQIETLTFVNEVESFVKNESRESVVLKKMEKNKVDDYNYGQSNAQINQINLNYLHNLGYTGNGINIAVFDSGFPSVNTNPAFEYIRNNNQIKGGYNFVDNNEHFYTNGNHGTLVLSTMAGYLENSYVGTAIDANYYLYITEDVSQESPIEEINWIRAAEQVDSIGIDVINTSLGYNEFDEARYNYTYADIDGKTAFITRGAQMASQKGIMLVTSAGNEGGSSWHYITAPADAAGVFTVGAVDTQGNPAFFTSNGPTYDNRIKPDIAALGQNAAYISENGFIVNGSGTSFSSPIMAGAMACLIEAFSNETPVTLKQKVRESAHLYNNPTNALGYGIPNFKTVYNSLLNKNLYKQQNIIVYPNPTYDLISIKSDSHINNIELYNLGGKILLKLDNQDQLNISDLPIGIYLLKLTLANGTVYSKKIIKR